MSHMKCDKAFMIQCDRCGKSHSMVSMKMMREGIYLCQKCIDYFRYLQRKLQKRSLSWTPSLKDGLSRL
ncbi:MAG: hypothetical protein ACFFG0_11455 [Candidatus Thorarchaeota archaeon]